METDDLVTRAQQGDHEAFGELTTPYRRELLVHCYRMLGSLQDAEDVLQDTLLAAWRGFGGFAGRSTPRTWLYRIATNQCLNARRATRSRPARAWDVPHVEPPAPSRLSEMVWLEPIPDRLLEGVVDAVPGPEARYEQGEAVTLAFVAALQALPPRQLAVLILRDVIGFRADEVAHMLDSTVEAVKSVLKRARVTMQDRFSGSATDDQYSMIPVSDKAVVAAFVRAWETSDVDGLVALLTDDAFMSMPPVPFEYHGLEAVTRFLASVFAAERRFELVPTRANGQPAFGAYLVSSDGTRHGAGLYVLALRGSQVCAMTRFEKTVLPAFGLPPSFCEVPPAARRPTIMARWP